MPIEITVELKWCHNFAIENLLIRTPQKHMFT